LYGKEGSNINFVKQIDEHFSLRTYERGVEDETLACGTGATAVAIAMNATGLTTATSIDVNVEGGKLAVSFDKKDNRYTNVFLIGPAEFVLKDQLPFKE
jgi:diaminopimelate epimerase